MLIGDVVDDTTTVGAVGAGTGAAVAGTGAMTGVAEASGATGAEGAVTGATGSTGVDGAVTAAATGADDPPPPPPLDTDTTGIEGAELSTGIHVVVLVLHFCLVETSFLCA